MCLQTSPDRLPRVEKALDTYDGPVVVAVGCRSAAEVSLTQRWTRQAALSRGRPFSLKTTDLHGKPVEGWTRDTEGGGQQGNSSSPLAEGRPSYGLSVHAVLFNEDPTTPPPDRPAKSSAGPYPVNALRNYAVDLVTTSHTLTLDVDFMPSEHLCHNFSAHGLYNKRTNEGKNNFFWIL